MWLFTLPPETGDVSWSCLLHWKLLQRIVNVETATRICTGFVFATSKSGTPTATAFSLTAGPRTGQGWNEGTTGDVLGEVLHVYPAHVKKALGMALLSGKF
jgi:hypothetical protein